jgi:hypothetical protein
MGFLNQLAEKYKTISIVGMAKNAGKTTTLNYLIEEAMDEGMVLGITSTGRDGENTDLVTGSEKPKVYLEYGTIVSVPEQLYELSDAGLEILRITSYPTAIGRIMLCRVKESGYVQIAGPTNTKDHKKMCEEMLELGAQLILIDGAIDRKSIAAPDTSDAVILATGAVLSRNLNKVVEETLHTANLYQLPEVPDGDLRKRIVEGASEEKIMLIEGEKVKFLDLATGLLSGKYLDDAITKETEWVYIPGAFTQSVIADIHPAKLRQLIFVVKDPTKVFIGAKSWKQLKKRGFRLYVLEGIKIAGISVNPYSPSGYSFEHKDLIKAIKEGLEDIPVFDVKFGVDYATV